MTVRRDDLLLTDSGLETVRYQSVGYRGTEMLIFLSRPGLGTVGAVPMVYCHGLLGSARSVTAWPAVRNLRYVAQAGIPVVCADVGGPATWANDDVVEPGAAIDDAIDFAAAEFGTRADEVIIAGESMGSWAAAAWAWRNIGRTAAVWLVAPIVDAQAFYTANVSMQGSIDTAYGGSAAFQAARPTHDPGLNTATITPLRARIRLDLSQQDPLIAPAIPIGWAATVGVHRRDVHVRPGGHDAPYLTVDGRDIAAWASSHVHTHRYL